MRISSIEIDGLTGRRKKFKASFDDNINVIWGSNGSGKTTVLKIIHSAMTGETAPLLRLSFTSAKVEFTDGRGRRIIRTLSRRESHRAALFDFTDSPVFENFTRDPDLERYELIEDARTLRWHSDGGIDEEGYLSHRYLPISRIFDFRNRQGRRNRGGLGEVLDEVEYDRVFAEQIQSLWSEFRSMALSHTRFAQQDAINRILGAVLAGDDGRVAESETAQVPIEDARRLVEEFFRANRSLGRHVKVDKVISDYEVNPLMNRVVRTVSEVQKQIEFELAPEKRFTEVLNELYAPNKAVDTSGPRRLSVTLGRTKRPIPIEGLSSGEKQVMRILLETLVAGSSPVIVDEPEISLHVDWHGYLLEKMHYINPDAQLVIASHSPEIVGALGNEGRLIEA
ncbi:AAA family ATPase [Paeniglutamicibacter sp. R2-26]|uniref:AAA family ATPase n=1 Tax=Paeniglutamicibacter sp. R2-26 TaxID=3144417 RepID=UPI003EE80877